MKRLILLAALGLPMACHAETTPPLASQVIAQQQERVAGTPVPQAAPPQAGLTSQDVAEMLGEADMRAVVAQRRAAQAEQRAAAAEAKLAAVNAKPVAEAKP